MGYFYLVVIVFIIIFYFRSKGVTVVAHHAPVVQHKIVGYRKRYSVMNKSEATLYFELKRQFSDYYIFPNMRLADIVDADDGKGFYIRRNKLLPKHIDFTVCDNNFRPLVAIELNGNSHNRLDRQEKDEEKRKILEGAGLPLKIIRTGENFEQSVIDLKKQLA